MRKAIGKKKPNLPSLPTATPNITTETPPTHSIGRYSPACMAGSRHGAVFRLSGGCGMRCFGFIRKNGGISYCFFRQDCCRFRRRCLTEGSLAAVAAILPEKTVRNAAIFDIEPKTPHTAAAGQTEHCTVPGTCHAGRAVPADASPPPIKTTSLPPPSSKQTDTLFPPISSRHPHAPPAQLPKSASLSPASPPYPPVK